MEMEGLQLNRWSKYLLKMKYKVFFKMYLKLNCITGAALGRVPWVPVNPWISRIFAEKPMWFDIKSDTNRIVNLWIEIPNTAPGILLKIK